MPIQIDGRNLSDPTTTIVTVNAPDCGRVDEGERCTMKPYAATGRAKRS